MQTGAIKDDLTEIKDLLSANKAMGSEKGDIAYLVSVSSTENVRDPVCQARGCKVPKSVSTEIANHRDHQSSRPPIITTAKRGMGPTQRFQKPTVSPFAKSMLPTHHERGPIAGCLWRCRFFAFFPLAFGFGTQLVL